MKRIFALLLFVLAANAAPAQDAAVRVNALALATGTLNAGVDVTVSRKWSITASGYWNPIATDNLRMQVLAGTVGVRRWRCEPHAGLFWGLHTGMARYRVGNGCNRYNGLDGGRGLVRRLCVESGPTMELRARRRTGPLLHGRHALETPPFARRRRAPAALPPRRAGPGQAGSVVLLSILNADAPCGAGKRPFLRQ